MELAPHPCAAELDMVQLTIMGLATIMTLLSIAIFVEEAFYLTRKIRCPIKMKTLRWSSSAPTVRWGAGASPQRDRATQGVPAPARGKQQRAKLVCAPRLCPWSAASGCGSHAP